MWSGVTRIASDPTPSGDLVANAPHMPVHLGSMGESIKSCIRAHPDMKPGDMFLLNTPYNGGTHPEDDGVASLPFHPVGYRFRTFRHCCV